jgi:hypothetical protein
VRTRACWASRATSSGTSLVIVSSHNATPTTSFDRPNPSLPTTSLSRQRPLSSRVLASGSKSTAGNFHPAPSCTTCLSVPSRNVNPTISFDGTVSSANDKQIDATIQCSHLVRSSRRLTITSPRTCQTLQRVLKEVGLIPSSFPSTGKRHNSSTYKHESKSLGELPSVLPHPDHLADSDEVTTLQSAFPSTRQETQLFLKDLKQPKSTSKDVIALLYSQHPAHQDG